MTTMFLILLSSGSFSWMKARAPMFCSPMELSMPAAVSKTRGGGLPAIGSRESPLTPNPPPLSGGEKSAQLLEGDDILELHAVAERPARGDDGVLELQAAEADAQVANGRLRRRSCTLAHRLSVY